MSDLLLAPSANGALTAATTPSGFASAGDAGNGASFASVLKSRLPADNANGASSTPSPTTPGLAQASNARPAPGSAADDAAEGSVTATVDGTGANGGTDVGAQSDDATLDPALAAWLAQLTPTPANAATPATPEAAKTDVLPANPAAPATVDAAAVAGAAASGDTADPLSTDKSDTEVGDETNAADAAALADPNAAAVRAAAAPAVPATPATPTGNVAQTVKATGGDDASESKRATPLVMPSVAGAAKASDDTAAAGNAPATSAASATAPVAAAIADDAADTANGKTGSGAGNSEFAQLIDRASAGLQNANASQTASTHAATRSEATMLHQGAGTPAWQNELGDRMVWMANSQRAQADLVLNPPQLGRIEVSLTVAGDQVSAVFGSPNAAVREMLENSLPRLREIFAGAGLDLGQADVNSGSADAQNGSSGDGSGDNGRRGGDTAHPADALVGRIAGTANSSFTRGGNALVDTFV